MPRQFFRLLAAFALALLITSCRKSGSSTSSASGSNAAADAPEPGENAIELLFTFGSEKEEWVKAVTADFNRSKLKTASGKTIFVRGVPKGSGELIDGLVEGTDQAHVASPASAAFIGVGNAKWRAKTGQDLIGPTENLVLSPVVIAMWQPMAEALGWGKQPVGWADILALSADPQGWASKGFPQWGSFKFAHTHPEFSNSGLISLFAEVYAATGKTAGLTLEDVAKPETARFLGSIERSVVHYGSSTGFFGKKMFANGPSYVSAAVLYENMVIEAAANKDSMAFPVVAIYPKEGTFWSDHPAGIVNREWVTPEHREAAKQYLAYLLARPQQQRAMEFGFRPALADLPLAAPIDVAHGVNPREPQTTLEVPQPQVMDAITRLWRENKKHSHITLVMDVSGSMNENQRMQNARIGGQELVKLLGDGDSFRLLPFNERVFPSKPAAVLKGSRPQAMAEIGSLIANGGTALYDAISTAYRDQLASATQNRDKISAIVVLTDGADTHSSIQLERLLNEIRSDNETKTIRVFTIGYDAGGQSDVLKKIADATQAKFYEGNPKNIREVFKDISTFF
ncbi:VWA domain-containing protein [Luteolibacter arcticus]|uniref:VWA domain-containing protein n=1 Tax=Luteolibacter arcticus TaxID=1581411 RepID=A0ABT3GLI1_9BACT|nr:VWA domain-containing protein [Luteolibacter arcticus]MCW1924382.1 VWA domain-containing protein [Luteolibacter arcticus]